MVSSVADPDPNLFVGSDQKCHRMKNKSNKLNKIIFEKFKKYNKKFF